MSTKTVSFDVVRMRPCFSKTGNFVSLICYNTLDDQSETQIKITKTKLTLTFEESSDPEKKENKKSRFVYPDHKQFREVVAFGKTHKMLDQNFDV